MPIAKGLCAIGSSVPRIPMTTGPTLEGGGSVVRARSRSASTNLSVEARDGEGARHVDVLGAA